MSLLQELKRRNVFRVGIAYALMGWVLLQAADFALDLVNAPNWVIQVFFIAVLIGLPIALFFAWAFELTPEGLKREHEVDRSQSIAPKTGRKLDRIIIAFLTVAVALLLLDRFREAPRPGQSASEELTAAAESPVRSATSAGAKDRSIAVLPLANRSTNPEDAFFAEGIHDEILTQLSRVSALRVISRTSVMGYAGTTKRMTEIGDELGVSTLLEGGVQRSGNRVRINVQLIDADSDEHLWAEVYDRELTADNLFDIQSDITRAIAGALQAVLTGEEQQGLARKPTDSVEAYAHFLRGKAESQGYGRDQVQIDRTITAYEAALALDPEFAEAWAALATDWTERYWNGDKLGDDLDHALAALEKARALAPNAPETLIAEGYYDYWGHLDYASAINRFEKALDQAPANLLALRGKAYVLRRMGDLEACVKTFEKIRSVDPLDPQIPADMGYTLSHTGQYERASELLRHAYVLDPVNEWNRFTRAYVDMMIGDLEGAQESLSRLTEFAPSYAVGTHLSLAIVRKDWAQADSLSKRLEEQPGTHPVDAGFLKVLIAHLQGDAALFEQKKAAFEQVVERLAVERPGEPAVLLGRALLAAFEGDQAAVREALGDYEASLKPDAMRIVENQMPVYAYALAGDTEALLDYMETVVDQFGPWELYYLSWDPTFDPYRALPRFQEFMAMYERWRDSVVK